jgi:Methyltransferase domain
MKRSNFNATGTVVAQPSRSGTGVLPFDQEQRYRLIGELLRALRGDGPPLRVLDVGGRTGALRRFLAPDDRVVLADPELSVERGLIQARGEALPFADDVFDAVVAADTLEHIPAAGREAFVGECLRVTRGWTLLAGPFHHPRVVEAEARLSEFVRTRIGAAHRYLDEHIALGLPSRSAVEGWCQAAGAREVRSLGHGNLERWLGLMCIALLLDRDPATRPAAERLHRFYNDALLPADTAGCVYRHVVLAVKHGPLPPSLGELLGPADLDPDQGAAIGHLLDELLTFDQGRDVLNAERARLEGELTRMGADLEGHADALRDARLSAWQSQQALVDVSADLIGHREALTKVTADLTGHREALAAREQELELARRELSTVQADARHIEHELLRKTRWRRRIRSLLGRRVARAC